MIDYFSQDRSSYWPCAYEEILQKLCHITGEVGLGRLVAKENY